MLKKAVFYLFARPFVAGETIYAAIEKAVNLNEKRTYSIINILGEHAKDQGEARAYFDQYFELIIKSAMALADVNVAIKPSQLGVEIDKKYFQTLLGGILSAVKCYMPLSLVEVDREDHAYSSVVKDICLELAKTYPNIRLCCQVNRKETPKEILQLIEAGVSVRLCKGTAYKGEIQDEGELRKIYLEQALLLSEKGNRPAIATHDLYLIHMLCDVENFEFQVLLGIENKEMFKLAAAGKKVGFYLPCGPNWYTYGKRRWKSIVKIFWRNWKYKTEGG